MEAQQVRLLMVEDAESDCLLFRIAMESAQVNMKLYSVTDGRGAMEYLLGRGVYHDRREYPLPDLIVLDLRLRQMSGTEFLHWCRGAPECRQIPVVILTGTFAGDEELKAALAAGAARVYLKPISITGLEGVVQDIYALGLRYKRNGGSSSPPLAQAA